MNDNEHLKIFLNPLAFVATMEGPPGGRTIRAHI